MSLTLLEDRIAELENQDQIVKTTNNDVNKNLQNSKPIEYHIPRTGLLSLNFFTRAFTVWRHYFVAQLIIGLIVAIVYMIMFVFILGNSMNF
jgi:hypothetical protein